MSRFNQTDDRTDPPRDAPTTRAPEPSNSLTEPDVNHTQTEPDLAALDLETETLLKLTDYMDDDEFKHIVNYKLHGTLSNNDVCDRKTLFTSDSYQILNNKLYRVTQPRAKRQSNISQTHVRLCIPFKYQLQTVLTYHRLLNHSGYHNLLTTMIPRVYFDKLNDLCYQVPRTCQTCAQVKPNREIPRQPLHPRPVKYGLFEAWQFDHVRLPQSPGLRGTGAPTSL